VFLCCAVCPLTGASSLSLLVVGLLTRSSSVTTASVAEWHQSLFPDLVEGFQKPRATIQKAAMVEEGVGMHAQGVLVDAHGHGEFWIHLPYYS
jgi:hypothetical protein